MFEVAQHPPLVKPLAVNADGASKLLGVAPNTLRNWRCQGRGPAFISLSKNRVIYKVTDLETWLDGLESSKDEDESSKDVQAGGAQ